MTTARSARSAGQHPGAPARLGSALALALAVFGAACSMDRESSETPIVVDEFSQLDDERESQKQDALAAPATEEVRLEVREGNLRAFGDAKSKAEPADAASPAARAPARKAKAPDTRSLSELDYRNAQNLSQRANEAYDYLGPQGDVLAGIGGKGQTAGAASQARRGAGRRSDVTRDEAYRLRERADAHALTKKNAVRGSLNAVGGRVHPQPTQLRVEGLDEDNLQELARAQTLSPAQRFQHDRRRLDDLAFQPAVGYWANTYVPGDPVLRWLESRLDQRDRAALEALVAQPLVLEAASQQTRQPFDAPHYAALSVFVQADQRSLLHESRMLVQVGLRGADRRSGLRPAMSIGIVLDARGPLPTDAAASIRALLVAFLDAKDVGDRFSLTVAGRPGGTLVEADDFRHGPLSIAMESLFGTGDPPGRGPVLGLSDALGRTARALQRGDDPAALLGSSMVLLVTSQPFGSQTEALAALAHQSAVAGVPVSVVAAGEGVNLDEIERVALAGQGNRRLLERASEAEAVVDRELSALARVIARALRLNIRLAPGVKLVEVVGADPLDTAGAQRVRQAEQSIDRRLSQNLGIERDRGEDEDGIQIVIPTFQSGDSHAVLLDVVAAGPGPIADVTVRYKDLVYLRNSVARTNLTLSRGSAPPGPLEHNVVKNYLALRLASTLKLAGRSLLEGGDARTIVAVRDFRELLESLRSEIAGFRNDAELATDSAMLGEYLALLEADLLDQDDPRQYLADSLQLSGYFKTIPRSRPTARNPWR